MKKTKFDPRENPYETIDAIFTRCVGELMDWYYHEKIKENVRQGIANAKRKQN